MAIIIDQPLEPVVTKLLPAYAAVTIATAATVEPIVVAVGDDQPCALVVQFLREGFV
jgi:hypothetical protein